MAIKIFNSDSARSRSQLEVNQRRLRKNLDRLSSGRRVNSASDDAAALAISQMFSAEIRSLGQAQRNTLDGVSMLQTAEGGLDQMGSLVGRMQELAVQASNGTLTDDQRGHLNDEFNALRDEMQRISSTSEFNGQQLLDGSASGVDIQVGTDSGATEQVGVSIGQIDPTTLGDGSTALDSVSLGTQADAMASLGVLDGAIEQISSARAAIGATQNRLTSTMENQAIERENLMSANSRLRDADVAAEASSMAQNQILSQMNISMVGQANRLSSHSLKLIQ